MAKPLVFITPAGEVPVGLNKVDRSKLYGYVDTQVLSDTGEVCALAAVASDGETLVGSGGTASAYLGHDGQWIERRRLKPINAAGEEIRPVPSSFAEPIPLDCTVTVEEFLQHSIRAVYALDATDHQPADVNALRDHVGDAIYTFPFSYRGGLFANTGFLMIGADGGLFLLVGAPTTTEFVGLPQQEGVAEEAPEEEEADDELDFAMM